MVSIVVSVGNGRRGEVTVLVGKGEAGLRRTKTLIFSCVSEILAR